MHVKFYAQAFLLLWVFSFTSSLNAQNLGEWNVYSSYSTVGGVQSSDNGMIFGTTLGGLVVVSDDQLTTYNTIDGMNRLNPTAIQYDVKSQKLFLGYSDGVIDVFDPETGGFTPITDISRVSEFTTRSINSMTLNENDLYIGTDFGIIVLNTSNNLVSNSYLKIGSFPRGTAIRAIDITSDSIFVATSQGVGRAKLTDNLLDATVWTSDSVTNVVSTQNVTDIVSNFGRTYAIANDSLLTLSSDSWMAANIVNPRNVQFLEKDGNKIYVGYSNSISAINSDGTIKTLYWTNEYSIRSLSFQDNTLYVGTAQQGLIEINIATESESQYLPDGPYLNFMSELVFENGMLIASATTEFPRSDPFNLFRGYYIRRDGIWESYNRNTNEELSDVNFAMAYTTEIGRDHFFIGSWGRGVVIHNKETNEINIYNHSNSGFSGITDNRDYVVISGLDTDSKNNTWATSFLSNVPLNVYVSGEEKWVHFAEEDVPKGGQYYDLFADSYNNLWISLISSNNGSGLLILNPGNDIEDTSDDTYRVLTNELNNGNLPDNYVTAFLEDRNGEVWIGTQRGIARFIFPNGITQSTNPNDYQSQWLINEDTSAISRLLLRDVNVSAMAVNAANEKWIGSANQGLWLINAEGSAIIEHYTTENSDLISNNILSIAIDDETGEVYISTDLGLVSYTATSKVAVQKMDELKVFPNPFVYSKNDKIFIEGLSEVTSMKVLGVDGTVVHELEARGGRTSWNGLDHWGNQLASGVYFVVAYTENGSQKGIGKVVIIR